MTRQFLSRRGHSRVLTIRQPYAEGGDIKPLKVIILVDRSTSMRDDGKMAALNAAMEEVIPALMEEAELHEDEVAIEITVIAFGVGASIHIPTTPIAQARWKKLEATDGGTDVSPGLDICRQEVKQLDGKKAAKPLIVLVADGLMAQAWQQALAMLTAEKWGGRAIRVSVACEGSGGAVDLKMLSEFQSNKEHPPFAAKNADQLVRLIVTLIKSGSQSAIAGNDWLNVDDLEELLGDDTAPGGSNENLQ